MEETLEDWQKRDKEAKAVTTLMKGPEPKQDAVLGAIVAAAVGFSISLMTLAFAGVSSRKSDTIVLVMTAMCAGVTFLYKALTYRSWRKEYWRQMDMRAPKPEPEPEKPVHLHFKDAKSALEYSCSYLNTTIEADQITPCVVVATSQSNQAEPFAVIDVPTITGPKRTVAAFINKSVPSDIAGRFCAAYTGPIDPETGLQVFIICAEFDLTWSQGAWRIKRQF